MSERGSWFADLMLPLSAPRRRSLALIVAIALGASACGSGGESTSPTLATTSPAEAAGDSADDGASPSADADDPADTSAPPGTQTSEPAVEDPASEESGENLFPDIDVVNIADGSTLNLAAELGGADRPTLLWFWAPH